MKVMDNPLKPICKNWYNPTMPVVGNSRVGVSGLYKVSDKIHTRNHKTSFSINHNGDKI